MAIRSKGICTWPGCNTLTIKGRCDQHTQGDGRLSAQERGYNKAWERLRNAYVRQHPVCEIQQTCNGDATVEVDHIIPLAKGGARLDERNLQGACKQCHAWKTQHVDRQRTTKFQW